MAVQRTLSGSDSSDVVAVSPGLLLQPQWLDYPRLEGVARQLAKKARFEDRQAIRRLWLKAWRLPQDAAFLNQVIAGELALPQADVHLQARGVPVIVVQCLRLLFQMSEAGLDATRFAALRADLVERRAELAGAIASQALVPSEPWPEQERAERLETLLSAWRSLPHAQDYLWRLQAERRDQAQRHQRWEQARQEREQARQREQQQQQSKLEQARDRLAQWLQEQGFTPGSVSVRAFEALQSGEPAHWFMTVHGRNASAAVLAQVFDLPQEQKDILLQAQAQREERLREQRRQRWAWEQECVGPEQVMALLGITRQEYEHWLADRRLPSVRLEERGAARSGRARVAHHPDLLAAIDQEQIEQWRTQLQAGLNARDRAQYERAADRARTQWRQQQVLGRIDLQEQCRHESDPDDAQRLWWRKDVWLPVAVPVAGQVQHWRANVGMQAVLPLPRTGAELDRLPARVAVLFNQAAQNRLAQRLTDALDAFLQAQRPLIDGQSFLELARALRQALEEGIAQPDIEAGDFEKRLVGGPVRRILESVERQRAQDLLRLGDFPQMFSLARGIRRHLVFRLGPTNSGKTHEALEALMEARSGVYLAPLRLLAMEVRDRLMAAGIACNLVTGEERVMVPGAQHTACTVEMMDPTHEVRVAVLDEIQMLQDEQRGWAWTAALVGMPARTLFVCGDPSVLRPCERLVRAMEESMELAFTERKTPLEVMAHPVDAPRATRGADRARQAPPWRGRKDRQRQTQGVAKGDAVVAFTRKDVLTLSARYRAQGLKVATIYGALAPEVRRTESERFSQGHADVLVATDAIGMGLNLPIRRVIFSTVHKFDGRSMRALNATEVRQIAGRAGRYGLYPKGYVGAMDPHDLQHVRAQLQADTPAVDLRLPIAPGPDHVQALAELLDNQNIGAVLQYFAQKVASDSPLFQTAGLKDAIELGFCVDRLAPRLDLREKFIFACAPVSVDKDAELDYFKRCLAAYVAQRPLALPPAPSWLKSASPSRLEDAELLSKQISLYAWFSMKFPQVFDQGPWLPAQRAEVSRFIERSLLHQSGFGQTSREAYGTPGMQRRA
ncbi:helicase-related protein [Alcaligenes sp. SDU_A2]|uniref:helicase-related protein n=1 Tax=Alcaligenes sp. SDU_A2 TaxID=3136634 RepID=UPI00311D78DF